MNITAVKNYFISKAHVYSTCEDKMKTKY